MGRKRKPGKREPNGRLQRDPQAETEWATMEQVLRRRCMELGWWKPRGNPFDPDTKGPRYEDMRRARDQAAGTLWGRLWLQEKITRTEYEVASAFVSLREDWLASIAAPGMAVGSMQPDARGASLVVENVRRVHAVRAAYLAAERALRGSGVQATRAVHLALFGGEVTSVAALRIGLRALAKQVDAARKAA